ncbi:hypothetical protein [Sporichthya polymorpha]|uniref:hypothetical protein n=1 Tax=Sporichthya polymorpha TaxID=35751 RepID=UPI000377A20B|nr:hypothetical protein [Sporichthya polymorpha]
MSRTTERVEPAGLPLEPLSAAASPVRDVPPLPTRVRRRSAARYWLFRARVGWRRRRLNGDAALLVLCFLLFAATIATGVGLVAQAA